MENFYDLFTRWFHDYRPMIRKTMRTLKYVAYLATIGRFLLTALFFFVVSLRMCVSYL